MGDDNDQARPAVAGHGRLLTWTTAARMSGVSERTLRRWKASGKLSVEESPRGQRVSVDELLRLGLLDKVDGQGSQGENMAGHAGDESEPLPVTRPDTRNPWREAFEALREAHDRTLRMLPDPEHLRRVERERAEAEARAVVAEARARAMEEERDRLRAELAAIREVQGNRRRWWPWGRKSPV